MSNLYKKFVRVSTELDTLHYWRIISGSLKTALKKEMVSSAYGILTLDYADIKWIRSWTRTLFSELESFKKEYAYLITETSLWQLQQEPIREDPRFNFPISRAIISFLNDDQFDWVKTHWSQFNCMPAAYILYHYLRPELHGSNTDEPSTLNKTKKKSIPRELQRFVSQLAVNIPSGDFCIEVDSLDRIKNRERLDISTAEFCNLLCYIYPFVEVGTLFSEGKLYLYSKGLKTIFPFDVAFANIDRLFEYAPHKAILESLDRIVRLDRSRTLFQTLEPVFRDYINTRYAHIANSVDEPSNFLIDYDSTELEEGLLAPSNEDLIEEESDENFINADIDDSRWNDKPIELNNSLSSGTTPPVNKNKPTPESTSRGEDIKDNNAEKLSLERHEGKDKGLKKSIQRKRQSSCNAVTHQAIKSACISTSSVDDYNMPISLPTNFLEENNQRDFKNGPTSTSVTILNEEKSSESVPCEDEYSENAALYERNTPLAIYKKATIDNNNELSLWKRLINGIIVGHNNDNNEDAPHKPILLITLINLIDTGYLKTNRIRYDEILEMGFDLAWKKYNNRTCFNSNLRTPYVTLSLDEIWNIETYDPSIKPQTTESWISKNVKYGSLHPEFYNTLKSSKEARQEIKEYIIRHFDLKH